MKPTKEWEEAQGEYIKFTKTRETANPEIQRHYHDIGVRLTKEEMEYFELEGKVLDIGGASAGYLIKQFTKEPLDYWTIDPLNEPGEKNIVGYGEDLSMFESQSFDCVVSLATIDHLFDIDKCFKEVKRVLMGGGKFCFAVTLGSTHDSHLIQFKKPEDVLEVIGRVSFLPVEKWKMSEVVKNNIMVVCRRII